jgi:hypothetical protein
MRLTYKFMEFFLIFKTSTVLSKSSACEIDLG